jgi:hypothetical protein
VVNIFAQELESVLSNHDKTLSSLYGLRIRDPRSGAVGMFYQIRPHKVTRLIQSRTKDITATLNADELEALQEWVPLDRDGLEMHRLRAALVAEAVRHLLAGRMATDQASDIGSRTLKMLLESADTNDVVNRVRGPEDALSPDEYDIARGAMSLLGGSQLDEVDDASEAIPPVLEPVIEAFEQGTLWLEIARETSDFIVRLGVAAMAKALLRHARDLLLRIPDAALSKPQHEEWRMAIEESMREISYMCHET